MPSFSAARAVLARTGIARLPPFVGPLQNFAAAKALVAAGTRNAIIHVDGDSTCVGSYANGGGLASGNCRPYGWPAQLAAALTSVKGSAQSWFGIAYGAGVNAYPGLDARVTPGSGWAAGGASSQSFGFYPLQATGTGQTLAFAPTAATDTLDIYYYQGLGAGSFTVNAGGGTLLTVNANVAPTAIKRASVQASAGSNAYTVTTNGGYSAVYGMEAYLSATKEVSIRNGGVIGSYAAQHVVSGTPYAPLAAIPFYRPDLAIIGGDINDMQANTPLPLLLRQKQMLIDAYRSLGTCDVIVLADNPIDPSLVAPPVQQAYVTGLANLAAINELPFVDVFALFGDFAAASARGWMANSIHPNTTGYGQIKSAVLGLIGP